MQRENTEKTEITEQTESLRSFRLFRYFRLFRILFLSSHIANLMPLPVRGRDFSSPPSRSGYRHGSAQVFIAISLGRHSGDFAEESCEVTLVLEAGAQPDFDNRQFAFDEQP